MRCSGAWFNKANIVERLEPGATAAHGVEGHAVAPGDTRALADALASWADPARREAVRQRLLEKAARFSVEENLARTLEVITSLPSPCV